MFKTFRLAFAASVLGVASPALAGQLIDRGNDVIANVFVQDLDLSKADAQSVLRQRIHKAAHRVCVVVTEDGPTAADYQECYDSASREAWKQANVKIAAATAKTMVASVGH